MTYIDDLYAERFRRSTWWDTTAPRPATDHDLAAAKRRRDVEHEARESERRSA